MERKLKRRQAVKPASSRSLRRNYVVQLKSCSASTVLVHVVEEFLRSACKLRYLFYYTTT